MALKDDQLNCRFFNIEIELKKINQNLVEQEEKSWDIQKVLKNKLE